jgi:hypothetical protein
VIDPPKCCYEVIAPGQRDSHGLHTHPDLLFTPVNHIGKRFGIDADASAPPVNGLPHKQDWLDSDEIRASNIRVLRAWDAKEGRFLSPQEIDLTFHLHS